MTVEQSQLVDEHRPKSEACGVDNALGGNLLVYLEDALEVLVDVLVGPPPEVAQKLAEILDVDLQELKARTLSPKRPPSTPTSTPTSTATAPGAITPGTQPARRDAHQRGRSRVSSPTTPSRTLPWSGIRRR
jgi:hypothetical protein